MAHEIRVPRLGWSMEEGTFIRWLKPDGAEVRAGEPLFELEGEKALQEIEAVDSGKLRIGPEGPAEGEVVAVGALLGMLVGEGETEVEETGNREQETEGKKQETGLRVQSAKAEGRVGEKSSPRARRVAMELGVDWKTLAGSGRGGRVRERDVRGAAGTSGARGDRLVPLTSRRRVIAERMAASCRQAAPVTLTTRCDATSLVAMRQQRKAAGGVVPAYTDIVAKLTAMVLAEHPRLAARWNGENLELPPPEGFHIGIAVDTDEGLLVPVLRDVARRGLAEIAADSRRLIELARGGKLATSDMQGGVFTITSLGAYGIDAFTPIINLPETAILGLGAIRREAVVQDDGGIVAREEMTLSLTFDHRAVDGAPAARFLQALAGALAGAAIGQESFDNANVIGP